MSAATFPRAATRRPFPVAEVVRWCCLGLVVLTLLTPICWMLLTSIKPLSEAFTHPYELWPMAPAWTNYPDAWKSAPFARYFFNSGFVSVVSTLVQVFLCSLAGYAFARVRFPARGLLFALVLATFMVPAQVTIVPLFVALKYVPLVGGNNWQGAGGFGLLNSYPGLMAPHLISAFGIFLMRQFFVTLPAELGEAARIDGASEFGIFWRVFFPLTGPALAVLAVFVFQDTWNDFLWPLVIIKTDQMKTLQLALSVFQQENTSQWTYLMAATTFITAPVVALFLFAQRYLKQGFVASGIKG
jgi:multiple sugar transport system permease protein